MCKYYDLEEEGKRSVGGCAENEDKKPPTNQQTPSTAPFLNYLQLKVGNMNWRQAKDVDVKHACVMVTKVDHRQHVILGNGYDIGLIFPKAQYKGLMKTLCLKPLRLPDRYDFD